MAGTRGAMLVAASHDYIQHAHQLGAHVHACTRSLPGAPPLLPCNAKLLSPPQTVRVQSPKALSAPLLASLCICAGIMQPGANSTLLYGLGLSSHTVLLKPGPDDEPHVLLCA